MRRRLMLLLCVVLLPIAAAGTYNEIRVRNERIDEVHAEALRTAQLVHSDVVNIVQGTRNLLVAMATLPAVRDLDRGQCIDRLTELRAKFDRYVSIVLTDWDGVIVCSSGSPMPPAMIQDRPYIAAARQTGDLVVGRFTMTRGSHLPVLPIAYPFRATGGEGAGILIAQLDLDWLSRHLAELPGATNGTIAVADRDGVFLARNIDASRYIGQRFNPDAMQPISAVSPGSTEVPGIDGIFRVIGYVPSAASPVGLYVGAGLDRAAAMRPVNIETAIEALGILAALLLALIAAWIGAGRFSRLQQGLLTRTAELEAEKEQRSRVEAVLVHSQKLEAVGQLTAGLAHDFNNLLAVVLGNIELARGRLGDNDNIDRLLVRATSAAERGSRLTQQLLAFARNQQLAIEPVGANQLIEDIREMLERSVGPSIRIHHDLAPDAAAVLVDRGQLEVALLNLVLNARDAMPLGGSIAIVTRNTVPDQLPADLAPGDYVLIRVTDTGPGMSPEVRVRAFEPFFTTKEIGKGSGLGLAQVFGIARQSGGTASLDSEPGQGASVAIYLPRAAVAPVRDGIEPGDAGRAAPAAALRVLLVDDDPDVRGTLATIVQSFGHSVTDLSSGAAALDRLSRDPDFDVLITDFVMPEMNGGVLAQRATELHPGLRVLVVTGFATGQPEAELPWPVLRKPFKAADIENVLRDLSETATVIRLPRVRR